MDYTLILTEGGDVYKNSVKLDIKNVNNIFAADDYYFVLDSQYKLYASGNNCCGQLGLGHNNPVDGLVKVAFDDCVQNIYFNVNSTIISSFNGLFAAGNNKYGQLGLGHNNDVNVFERVIYLSTVYYPDRIHVHCGYQYMYVLSLDGLYSCGKNTHGQLGLGHFENVNKLTKLRNVTYVSNMNIAENFVLVRDYDNYYICGCSEIQNYTNTNGQFVSYLMSPDYEDYDEYEESYCDLIDINDVYKEYYKDLLNTRKDEPKKPLVDITSLQYNICKCKCNCNCICKCESYGISPETDRTVYNKLLDIYIDSVYCMTTELIKNLQTVIPLYNKNPSDDNKQLLLKITKTPVAYNDSNCLTLLCMIKDTFGLLDDKQLEFQILSGYSYLFISDTNLVDDVLTQCDNLSWQQKIDLWNELTLKTPKDRYVSNQKLLEKIVDGFSDPLQVPYHHKLFSIVNNKIGNNYTIPSNMLYKNEHKILCFNVLINEILILCGTLYGPVKDNLVISLTSLIAGIVCDGRINNKVTKYEQSIVDSITALCGIANNKEFTQKVIDRYIKTIESISSYKNSDKYIMESVYHEDGINILDEYLEDDRLDLPTIINTYCGRNYIIIQTDDGLYGCGNNEYMQLGLPGQVVRQLTKIPFDKIVDKVNILPTCIIIKSESEYYMSGYFGKLVFDKFTLIS